MAKILSIANQKGGVGKSTLVIQLAFYLAAKKHRVAVIDLDGQGNTSSRLGPRETIDGQTVVSFTGTRVVDLFEDTLAEPLKFTVCPSGVHLFHAEKNDAELFEIESVALSASLNPKKHLHTFLHENYDFVIIDCPPSLGRKLVAALAMSTHVLCPVQLSGFAVDGLEGLLRTIMTVKGQINPALKIAGVLVNNMDRSVNQERSYKGLSEALEESFKGVLFDNLIMHRPPIDHATSEGVSIETLRYGHVAAKEMKVVLDELMHRVEAGIKQ